MFELINGSWEQTRVYLLNEILKEVSNRPDIIVNPPQVNVSVNPPQVVVNPPEVNVSVNPAEVNINIDQILSSIENINNKIEDIQPVIVIDKIKTKALGNGSDGRRPCKNKRKAQVIVNKKPQLEVDDKKWIIVEPSKIKTGWIEALYYDYGKYKQISEKLFWFGNDIVRTILIAEPKVPTKEYYLSAFEEARLFGVELSDYYKNKIKNI